MRRVFIYLVFAFIFLLFLPSAFAGDEKDIVSGEVEGVWTAGSSHIVDDYAFVPPEKVLLIEEGVEITFLTSAVFDVMGELFINGTASSPVMVFAPDGWEGFNFPPGRLGTDSVKYLNVGISGGIPQHVIRATRRNIKIVGCTFVSDKTCLWISRGRVWADHNNFRSIGRFSSTVRFDSLVSDRVSPWDPIDANYLKNSFVIADAPNSASLPPTIWLFTTALRIESSNEAVISRNAFVVNAPGYAFGVYYGNPNSSSATGATIQHCSITAQSYNLQARGVVNQCNGYLDIRQCDIDVRGGFFHPIGVSATNSAQTSVNSCILNLSDGQQFGRADSTANIMIMFSNLWKMAAFSSAHDFSSYPFPEEDKDMFGSKLETMLTVVQGEGNIEADPLFNAIGTWGQWTDLPEVKAYYSLQPESPCIDQGDIALPPDPDNTQADIGCFYYAQTGSGVAPSTGVSVPHNLLLTPYPNPFNSSVSLPFAVERSGKVRLTAYDILGRPVAELVNGQFVTGNHIIQFQARGLASGIYIIEMEYNGIPAGQQKLMLIR